MIFEKIRFYSPLSKEALVAKLGTKVNLIPRIRVGGFGKPKNGKVFEGELTKDGFRLQRIINYKNSLLPKIYGKFIEKVNGTEISVTIRPDMSVIIFMIFWLGVVCLSSFDALNNFPAETFNLFTLFPVLLLIASCIVNGS